MEHAIYFNKRAGQNLGLARVLLIVILFAAVAQFASFGIIQAHVISFYGAQPEDITFAFQIAYVGIIATLPIMFRLIKFFNTRSYLLTAFLAGILLNIACLYVRDLVLFSIIRFFIGGVTCLIAGCLLIVLFSTLPESKRMLVGVSLFFSLILTTGLIVGVPAAQIIQDADWTGLYYALISLQVIAILCCVSIFRTKVKRKSYPLYQVDWAGYILIIFGAAAAAFVMIYGPKRYWFADPLIRYTATTAVLLLSAFLYRQTIIKRPLVDLRVFRSGKFIFGLLLMLLFFGVKDSINLVYGYAAGVLGWSTEDVVNAGLFNIAGVVIATFIVIKVVLAKKKNLPKLLLAGFAVLCIYHWWVYRYLTPDLSFAQLSIPVFLQGLGSGLLFVPITILCMASALASTGMTGIVVLTYTRFMATLNSIAGYYTLQLNYNQHFKTGFLGKLSPGTEQLVQRQELYNGIFAARGFTAGEAAGISNMLIAKSTGIQGQLLTVRAVFLVAGLVTAVGLVMLVVFAVVSKVKEKRETMKISGTSS